MAIILSMDMIYFTIEGIVPSCCRLTTRHLGATLFKLRSHQICKSHVTASMHHDTWGLMQSHFYWLYWRPDSSHHNEPALGGYQLLLSTIQGTQVLKSLYWKVHYSVGKAQSSSPCGRGFKPHDGGYIIWCSFQRSIYKSPSSILSYWAGPWGLHVIVQVYMIIFIKSLLIIA